MSKDRDPDQERLIGRIFIGFGAAFVFLALFVAIAHYGHGMQLAPSRHGTSVPLPFGLIWFGLFGSGFVAIGRAIVRRAKQWDDEQ